MWIEKVMNAWTKSAGLLGVLGAVAGTVLLPAQPANAQQQGIQTAAGLSTPLCGLSNKVPYPSCPLSTDNDRIAEGFKINPVPLNMTGLDVKKVGVGSYWVNSAGACNGCHGGQFATGGNPGHLPVSQGGDFTGSGYTGTNPIPYNPSSAQNPATFLAGGNNFASKTGACDASGMGACGTTVLVSRNLTPDFSTGVGLPEHNTLQNFIQTLRTGHDFQKVHLTSVTAPSDGSKLQIMPWPALGSATDYDLEFDLSVSERHPLHYECRQPLSADYQHLPAGGFGEEWNGDLSSVHV